MVGSRELLAHELADGGAVRATCDLRHDVGHHPAHLVQARGPVLGDGIVDDALELLLRERLGHELLEHVELGLLAFRLRRAPGSGNGPVDVNEDGTKPKTDSDERPTLKRRDTGDK